MPSFIVLHLFLRVGLLPNLKLTDLDRIVSLQVRAVLLPVFIPLGTRAHCRGWLFTWVPWIRTQVFMLVQQGILWTEPLLQLPIYFVLT